MAHSAASIIDLGTPLSADVGKAGVRTMLLRRALGFYALVFLIGLLPLLIDARPGWQAAGLGLWFPGLGFLAAGGWAILGFPLTAILVTAGFLLWFAMGAIAVPLALWVLAAGISGLCTGGAITPWSPYAAGFVTAGAGLAWLNLRRTRTATYQRQRAERLIYLPAAIERQRAGAVPVAGRSGREMSEEDVAHARFVLERGLQPLDSFDGFVRIDQFQPAALRYQLNFLQYALGVQQCLYTPNFHGYLSEAQRNLIEKFQDKRVWGYWVYEKLLGHFSTDFDPIGWDNIMLGGFMNLNINMYQGNTGDMRYDRPGSFQFRLNRYKTYEHDAHSINRVAIRNFKSAALGLYPCEPALAYPFCNVLGLSGLPAYDRAHGTHNTGEVRARFRKHFEEDLTRPNFDIMTGVCNWTGTEVLLVAGGYLDMAMAWLLNAHFPDISQRMWAIAREETIRRDGERLTFNTRGAADNLDLGNYTKSQSTITALTLIGAHEMGDDDLADAALRTMEPARQVTEDGLVHYGASPYTEAHLVIGRLLRRDDWRRVVNDGPSPSALAGPILADAAYPEVLVARAFSTGEDLDLVLYSGARAAGRSRLGIERLEPGRRYRLEGGDGGEIVADAQGRASIDIAIRGRTALRLVPAS